MDYCISPNKYIYICSGSAADITYTLRHSSIFDPGILGGDSASSTRCNVEPILAHYSNNRVPKLFILSYKNSQDWNVAIISRSSWVKNIEQVLYSYPRRHFSFVF
mgnify:CR=1 FL=1